MQEHNPIDSTEVAFRKESRRTVHFSEPGVKFTRLRYLGGMTPYGWQWDLSYAHGIIGDEPVNLRMHEGSYFQTVSSSQNELIFHLVKLGQQYGVHMMRAGLRDALSTLK